MPQTIAEQIARQFGDDGQQWIDDNGQGLELVAGATANRTTYKEHGIAGSPIRYEFEDGSAIVTAGDAWDIGVPGHDLECWCWPEAQHEDHQEDCPETS